MAAIFVKLDVAYGVETENLMKENSSREAKQSSSMTSFIGFEKCDRELSWQMSGSLLQADDLEQAHANAQVVFHQLEREWAPLQEETAAAEATLKAIGDEFALLDDDDFMEEFDALFHSLAITKLSSMDDNACNANDHSAILQKIEMAESSLESLKACSSECSAELGDSSLAVPLSLKSILLRWGKNEFKTANKLLVSAKLENRRLESKSN